MQTSSVDEEKEVNFRSGLNRMRNHDYKGALNAFEKSLHLMPNSSSAHFQLGALNEDIFKNYAEAIYHYQKMLKANKEHHMAGQVLERIDSCKRLIASDVSLDVGDDRVERELVALQKEKRELTVRIKQLEGENEKLKLSLTERQSQTNAVAASSAPGNSARPHNRVPPSPVAPSRTVRSGGNQPAANPPAARKEERSYVMHKIRTGDTLYSLGARYGLNWRDIQRANPGLRPSDLKVGQNLRIPVSKVLSRR